MKNCSRKSAEEKILLTETEAKELIGCARVKIREWIDEGKLWAVNISTNPFPNQDSGYRYRISRDSALAMQKICRSGSQMKTRPLRPRIG